MEAAPLLVLGLAILVLLTMMLISRGGGETAGASSEPTAPTPAKTGAPSTATDINGRYLSGEGRPIGLNVGRQSVSQFTLFKIGVCLRQTYVLQHILLQK